MSRPWHIRRFGGGIVDGERLIPYAHDMAGCSCEPTGRYLSIFVIPVGRSRDADRCLICGARWCKREFSRDPLRILAPGEVAPRYATHRCGPRKLDVETVREIRASEESPSVLARRFHVDPVTIGHVRTRRTWAWVA